MKIEIVAKSDPKKPVFSPELTELHIAVAENDVGKVKVLADKKDLLNARVLKSNNPGDTGVTAVNMACRSLPDTRILKILIDKEADLSIATDRGLTPLRNAAYFNKVEHVVLLVAANRDLNVNQETLRCKDTALMVAVSFACVEIVRLILNLPGMRMINHQDVNGDSALSIAARQGSVEKVMVLLEAPDIDIFAKHGHQAKTALQIAEDFKHTEVCFVLRAREVFIQLSNAVDVSFIVNDPLVVAPWLGKPPKTKPVVSFPTYTHYLKAQCKMPSYMHLCNYLLEIRALLAASANAPLFTKSENDHAQARRTWSEVVTAIKEQNQQELTKTPYRLKNIERIRAFYKGNDVEKVYMDCLAFVQNNSSLVVTFNAGLLKKGLNSYQLLNIFENNIASPAYIQKRDATEQALFQTLDEKLKNRLFHNVHARPHYAALILHDGSHIAPIEKYGKSYVVFRDLLKASSLFAPMDSLVYKFRQGVVQKLCGWQQLELLLFQASPLFLQALVVRVTQGFFPDYYTQQYNIHDCVVCCSYIEALIPPADFFNPLFVAHIHIDEKEHKLSVEEKAVLDDLGLSVSNCILNPYPELRNKLLQSVESKDYKGSKELLRCHPSLLSATNNKGYSLFHMAIQAGVNPLVQLFLAWGFNANVLTLDNQNALTLALEFGSRAMVQMIMPRLNIAFINHKNAKGESALFVAAKKGYLITVMMLLGIPGVDAQASCGTKTAAQVARECRYFRVANCIRIFLHQNSKREPDVKSKVLSAWRYGAAN